MDREVRHSLFMVKMAAFWIVFMAWAFGHFLDRFIETGDGFFFGIAVMEGLGLALWIDLFRIHRGYIFKAQGRK